VAVGVCNTRELGGLPCHNGTVRHGLIWRGALHDEPVPCATGGVPRAVHLFDLRQPGEVRGEPTPGVCRHRWPLHDPGWTRDRTRDAQYYVDSGLRLLPTLGECIVDILKTLATGQLIFVGCRLGKDRTGLVLLVLGRIIGVRQDALIDDYLRTANAYLAAPEWVARYARARGEDPADVWARLTPPREIPAGILAGLPDDPAAVSTMLGVRTEVAARARTAVLDYQPHRNGVSR
jgi:protein-tyrosine phosphatase